MNETAARQENKIMNIISCNTFGDFNNNGELSPRGKTSFWMELDDNIA